MRLCLLQIERLKRTQRFRDVPSHHWRFEAPHRDPPLGGGRRHADPAHLLLRVRGGGREGRELERGERLGRQRSGAGGRERLPAQTLGGVRPPVALGALQREEERDPQRPRWEFQTQNSIFFRKSIKKRGETSVSRLISRRLSYRCSSLVNSLRRPWYFLLSSSSSALRPALA